jgi:hypothetical protein
LALRRDLHNRRTRAGKKYAALLPHLDHVTADVLQRWSAASSQAQSLDDAARLEFEREMNEARRAMAAVVLENEYFACGLQTANRRVYQQTCDYAQAMQSHKRLDKKLRNTEDRLISFIYKVVAKPSPFASFASILLRSADGTACPPHARREVRLARDVLLWLQAQCIAASPALAQHLPLHLNNTIKVDGERVELFTRGRDGTAGMLGGERFLEMKYSPALALVLRRCAAGSVSLQQLEGEFSALGLAPDRAREYLAALLGAGVLELDFGIPDQAVDFAARAAAILEQLPQHSGQPFAALFARLAQLERDIGAEHRALARQPLVQALGDCLADFARALGTDPEALRQARDLYFEDVGSVAAAPAMGVLLEPAEHAALVRLTPLLMLFDAQLTSRMSLATLFAERYGSAATVALLDFYKDYRATPKEELFARLDPSRDERIAALMQLRSTLCAQVARAMADGREVDLAQAPLAQLIDSLPVYFDRRSVSVFVQRCQGEQASLVLNGAGTGFGSAMSRFAHLFDGPDGSLGETLAAALATMPGAAHAHDVCAVLAANSNLHPPLLQRELVYPGARASQAEGTVSLRDVQVVCRHGMLALQRADHGTPLDLLSLNFIHPAAGPALYRFLHLFSSHWVYRSQDLLRALMQLSGAVMPRLRLGPVVLCRQLWQHPVAQVLDAVRAADTELDTMLALDAWRTSAGLPRVVFFRAATTAQAPADLSSLEQVMALRRGRLRKPHLLDFQNPFLVRIFLKQLAALAPDDMVQLQESLPDFAAPRNGPVSELLIQLDHVD